MVAFNRHTWEERVRTSKVKDRRYRDMIAVRDLSTVIEWCRVQGIEVGFTRMSNGEYDPDNQQISVSSAARPETQLFILLHECGHHLFKTTGRSQVEPTRVGSTAYVVEHLSEEFEAWRLGSELAQDLDIALTKHWHVYKTRCLASYIDWAAKRGQGYSV